jgi:hypothetical protein
VIMAMVAVTSPASSISPTANTSLINRL